MKNEDLTLCILYKNFQIFPHFWKYGQMRLLKVGKICDRYVLFIRVILYLVLPSEMDPRWPIEGGCDLSSQASQHLAIRLRLRYMKKPSITNLYHDISHRAIYLCQRCMKKTFNKKVVSDIGLRSTRKLGIWKSHQ